MTITVPDVMRHVRNFFAGDSIRLPWTITDGMLQPASHFFPGEWIAIADGPAKGVWQLDENGAIPCRVETTWEGCIIRLSPPAGFLQLCGEIANWADAHSDPTTVSERFGEYSRSQKGSDWTEVFAQALKPYQRMYPEVNL